MWCGRPPGSARSSIALLRPGVRFPSPPPAEVLRTSRLARSPRAVARLVPSSRNDVDDPAAAPVHRTVMACCAYCLGDPRSRDSEPSVPTSLPAEVEQDADQQDHHHRDGGRGFLDQRGQRERDQHDDGAHDGKDRSRPGAGLAPDAEVRQRHEREDDQGDGAADRGDGPRSNPAARTRRRRRDQQPERRPDRRTDGQRGGNWPSRPSARRAPPPGTAPRSSLRPSRTARSRSSASSRPGRARLRRHGDRGASRLDDLATAACRRRRGRRRRR